VVADRYERYEISDGPDGLHVFMWQVLPRIGGGVIALVMLAACFATDPYEGHGRIWAGVGVVALALVAMFGVRVENWVFSENEVRYKSSLWDKEHSLERSPDTPLVLRFELLPSDAEGTRPPFPHIVRLVGPGGIELGDGFRFRDRSNLERFLEALRTVAQFDVVDLQSEPL
jgi:hypothetical protein